MFQSPKLRRWKAFLTPNQAKLSLFRLSRLRCRQRNLKIRWPAARLVPHPPDRVTWFRQSPQLAEDSTPDLPLDKQTTDRPTQGPHLRPKAMLRLLLPHRITYAIHLRNIPKKRAATQIRLRARPMRPRFISPSTIRSTAVRKPSTTRVGTEYCPWPLRRSAQRLNG